MEDMTLETGGDFLNLNHHGSKVKCDGDNGPMANGTINVELCLSDELTVNQSCAGVLKKPLAFCEICTSATELLENNNGFKGKLYSGCCVDAQMCSNKEVKAECLPESVDLNHSTVQDHLCPTAALFSQPLHLPFEVFGLKENHRLNDKIRIEMVDAGCASLKPEDTFIELSSVQLVKNNVFPELDTDLFNLKPRETNHYEVQVPKGTSMFSAEPDFSNNVDFFPKELIYYDTSQALPQSMVSEEVSNMLINLGQQHSLTVADDPGSKSDGLLSQNAFSTFGEVESMHNCFLCTKLFVTKDILNIHLMNVHGFGPRYSCVKCEQSIYVTSSFMQRLLQDPNEQTKLCCVQCEMAVMDKNNAKFLCSHLGQDIDDQSVVASPSPTGPSELPRISFQLDEPVTPKDKLKNHYRVIRGDKLRFCCSHCDTVFETRGHLKRHLLMSHGIGPVFKCLQCDRRFLEKANLKRHMITVHCDEPRFICSLCDKKFSEKGSLKRHVLTVHADCAISPDESLVNQIENAPTEPLFDCPHCSSKFAKKLHLKKHIYTAHGLGYTFGCPQCEKKFSQRGNLNKHMLSVHGEGPKFMCPHCNKKFTEKGSLKRHIVNMHEGGASYSCSHCDEMFSTQGYLQSHLVDVHNDAEAVDSLDRDQKFSWTDGDSRFSFMCSTCGSKFMKKSGLKRHLLTVHNLGPKFQCSVCEKVFKQKSTLKNHILTLHGDRPRFTCSQCDKKFTEKCSLNKHLLNIHGEKPKVSCSQCSKTFATKSLLKMHLKNFHSSCLKVTSIQCNKSYSDSSVLKQQQLVAHGNKSKFTCSQCEKKFPDKRSMRMHILTAHEASSKFVCQHCNRKFTQKFNLKKHLFVVHNSEERRFVCFRCNKKFVHKHHLKRHRLNVHGIR